MSSKLRLALGALVVLAGVVLIFSPDFVRTTFQRPAETVGQRINLRATFGGAVAGLGAFVMHADAFRPLPVLLAKLLLWTMAWIAAARVVGFVLDGAPDRAQIVWVVTELLLVIGALLFLRRQARAA